MMPGFADIIGHEDTVRHLQQALTGGMVSHAYLIEGDAGSGKHMIAQAFAAALLCEQSADEACGVCRSCRLAQAHTHPDIRLVEHEKPGLISVEEIRRQVVGDVLIRPYQSAYKVYIIPDAEKMNTQAQNALLKTLEEPPAYAVILLLTVNASALLETIRSRCVHLPLRPLPAERIQAYLMEKRQLPDYQAQLCTAFAQGSLGKALELAGSEYFTEIRSRAIQIASRSGQMSIAQLSAAVRSVSDYKVTIQDFLDILAVWYRDVLYFKATKQVDKLVFTDQIVRIREMAGTCSYEGLEEILKALGKASERLSANVNFDLAMELLFLTIRDHT